MTHQTIAIFGAASAIAKEYGRLKTNPSTSLIVVARNAEALHEIKADLSTRGAGQVHGIEFDFNNLQALPQLVEQVFRQKVDVALVAYGVLPDNEKSKTDSDYFEQHYRLNSTSTLMLLSLIANKMRSQGSGTIAAISSVAGDRGKKSNYYYGAAKASVSVFMQGLRQDLFKTGVHVLDIKPGFVDTPMTSQFPKGPIWAKPNAVAAGIDKAIEKKKSVVYLPWFWKHIMCIIKSIPEFIFKKLEF